MQTCFPCGQEGHKSITCPALAGKRNKEATDEGKKDIGKNVGIVTADCEEEINIMPGKVDGRRFCLS